MRRLLLVLPCLAATTVAVAAEPPPLPAMRDGLRAMLTGSTDMALGRGDVESAQLLYMVTLNPGAKYGWTHSGRPDVYFGRHDLSDGRIAARDAYQAFTEEARRRRAAIGKPIVIGRYIGAQTVRTDEQLAQINRWPPHNAHLDRFEPQMLRPPRSDLAKTDHARIDYRRADARDRAVAEFLAEARGERGAPRPDLLHFDEVVFLPEFWPGFVDVFSRLKPLAHAEGVRLSINLGGYSWRDAPNWAPDVLDVLPTMTDSVQVEGLPDRHHGGLRPAELSKSLGNVRRILAAGLGMELIPFNRPNRVPGYRIVDADVTTRAIPFPVTTPAMREGKTKLLVTLDHPAFSLHPLGGAPWEMTVLPDEPASNDAANLPSRAWTAIADPDDARRVFLFRRDADWDETLAKVRERRPGYSLDALRGRSLHDMQGMYRTTAAFALAACRNFDDSIVVHHSPQSVRPDVLANFFGRLGDDWSRWPELLGAPTGEPEIISTAASGNVELLRRRFRNATLLWYVDAGYVRFAANE